MDVKEDMYKWMRSLEPNLPVEQTKSGVVHIGKAGFQLLLEGKIPLQAAKRFSAREGKEDSFSNDTDSKTMSDRSEGQGWQAAFSVLEAADFAVNPELKTKILTGDVTAMQLVLTTLWEREQSERNKRNKKGINPSDTGGLAVSLPSIDPAKPLINSRTCLEFLLLSFCANFHLTPYQAAGLLTQGNKYLALILGKGLKQSFQPVLQWYTNVRNHLSVLLSCIDLEPESTKLVLSAFRPGLLSKDLEVVKACCTLLRDIGQGKSDQMDAIWTWVVGDMGGVDASVSAVRKHGKEVWREVSEMLFSLSSGHLTDLVMVQIRGQMKDFDEFIQFVSELMLHFLMLDKGKETIAGTDLPAALLSTCLHEAENSSKRSLRFAALNLASSLWSLFSDNAEQDPSLRTSILNLFKRGCRDKSVPFSHCCIAQLFRLLEHFYSVRNQSAAVILNVLQIEFIDLFHVGTVREFLLGNFMLTAERIPSFPIEGIADAVIKQWNLDQDLEFNTFDLNFFIEIARHPRLKLETAVALADLLGQNYLSRLHLSKAVSLPFMLVVERFQTEEAVQEYLYRLCKLASESILPREMKKVPMQSKYPRYMSQPVRIGPTLTIRDVQELTTAQIQRHLVLELVEKCARLNCQGLNDRLKKMLAGQACKVRKEKGDLPKGWVMVLNVMGKATEIISAYEASRSQIVARSPAVQPLPALEYKPSVPLPEVPNKQFHIPVDNSSFLTEKRKQTMRNHSSPDPLKSKESAVSVPQNFDQILNVSDLEVGEEDMEAVLVLFRKYGKLLKALFKYYAGSGFHKGVNSSFSRQIENVTRMSESEFSHLVRDLGITHQSICKTQLIALLNYCSRASSETLGFDFSQFQDLLIKTALLLASKTDQNLLHLPAVFSIQCLIDRFRSHVKTQFPILTYDEPWLMPGDAEIMRKLNSDLTRDPTLPLPKGYRRMKDQNVTFKYRVPSSICQKEGIRVGLEVLDGLLGDLFGVHFLEPLVCVETVSYAAESFRSMTSAAEPRVAQLAYNRLSSAIKIHSLNLARFGDSETVLECAQLVEDLIYSLENGFPMVVPQRRNDDPFRRQKKMKEQAVIMEKTELQRAEKRRKLLRDKMLEAAVEMSDRRMEKRKEEMKAKREEE